MVNLTKIYTRTGDAGQTNLSDMSIAAKTDPRVCAYGDVDEANAVLGVALAAGLPDAVAEVLRFIQNELFDVGADLSTPLATEYRYPPLRIEQDCIDRLEAWCDGFGEDLPALRSFILPGGSSGAAHLHLARTVVRRAERSAWIAANTYGDQPGEGDQSGGVNLLAVKYLNRLSDLLFIMVRVVNGADGDILWLPGGDREPTDARGLRQRERIIEQNAKHSYAD